MLSAVVLLLAAGGGVAINRGGLQAASAYGQAASDAPALVTASACAMADGTPITAAFLPLAARWGDAVVLADNTPRIALSGAVGQLQAIRREVESVDWPPCARRAADLLSDGMNSEISGYLGFMSGHRPEETRALPDVGTLSYAYLVQMSGVAEANRLFDADYYAVIDRGRATLVEFGTELAYASGEQPRPE